MKNFKKLILHLKTFETFYARDNENCTEKSCRQTRKIKPMWSALPLDICVKIPLAIPDFQDLLAFIEALRPYKILGPLGHLYNLHRALKWNPFDPYYRYDEMWPTLRLTQSILYSPARPSYEAIARHYGLVSVKDVWENVEWLKTHLNLANQIEWNLRNIQLPLTMEIADAWSDLRITRLVMDIQDERALSWCVHVLPRLPHLVSVKLYFGKLDVADFFTYLATFKKITDVEFASVEGWKPTESQLLVLSEWFCDGHLQKFSLEAGSLCCDREMKQLFYEAMFNCPTLDTLVLHNCFLVDFTGVIFSMKTLVLDRCRLTSFDMQILATRLEKSDLLHLEVNCMKCENTLGIESLLIVQPHTSIKHLGFSDLPMDRRSWLEWTPLLEKCTLEKLTLHTHEMPSMIVRILARTLHNNRTICELILSDTRIAYADLRTLTQSITHPSRHVRAKRVKWTTRYGLQVPPLPVYELRAIASERGGEFLYV
ncbi:hypothetical protein LEN26_016222 [Aphanomyces euteiches]|nr:hypothetical protein LEN26_016222 [Aphanomyces euteiches]